MSDRLTEEALLRDYAERFPSAWQALRLCAAESAALHARVARLEAALTKIRDNDPDSWEASIARAALVRK